MVHKQATPLQRNTRQQNSYKIMLSHGIIHGSHVAGLLSLIDGVTNAIDVQVTKGKGDLEQEIVIISQLHVINVQ
jgi:hypothetical protein